MPPFVKNQYGIGYDQENASLTGRIISFIVKLPSRCTATYLNAAD
jgi:hypothetical protein